MWPLQYLGRGQTSPSAALHCRFVPFVWLRLRGGDSFSCQRCALVASPLTAALLYRSCRTSFSCVRHLFRTAEDFQKIAAVRQEGATASFRWHASECIPRVWIVDFCSGPLNSTVFVCIRHVLWTFSLPERKRRPPFSYLKPYFLLTG